MKSPKRVKREARELFVLCLVNGRVDEPRVRHAAQLIIGARRPGYLAVLSYFHRLVRLDLLRHAARIESAIALPAELRAHIESNLARIYGDGLALVYAVNPGLIGGMRITVGSDVYDGSVKGSLAALAERFS
jgi:F-type H+-transporting ATPase subunit delta